MATETLTKSYQGPDLSGETSGVIYVPISYDSTILAIKVKTDVNVDAEAELVLTNLDGMEIAGSALTIESGTKKGVLTGLEIARLEDEDVLLKLVSGAVSSPITLVLVVRDDTFEDISAFLSDLIDVEIDDPQPGDELVYDDEDTVWRNQPAGGDGGSLPEGGDVNPATNTIEKINGRAVDLDDLPASYQETFDSGAFSETYNLNSFNGTASLTGSKARFVSNNGGAEFCWWGFAQNVPRNWTNKTIEFEIAFTGATSGDVKLGVSSSNSSPTQFSVTLDYYFKIAVGSPLVIECYNSSAGLLATYTAGEAFTKVRLRDAGGVMYYEVLIGEVWVTMTTRDYTGSLPAMSIGGVLYAPFGGTSIALLNITTNFLGADTVADNSVVLWKESEAGLKFASPEELAGAIEDFLDVAVIQDGDVNLGTNTIEKVQGRDIDVETPAGAFDMLVTWGYLNGASESGNRITNNLGDTWIGGGLSDQIMTGDGSVKWTYDNTQGGTFHRKIGLTAADDTPTGFADMDYALFFTDGGAVNIYEGASNPNDPSSIALNGVVYEIRRNGTTISYWRNNVLLYTSATPSSGPLRAHAQIYMAGQFIEGIGLQNIPAETVEDGSVLALDVSENKIKFKTPAEQAAAVQPYLESGGGSTGGASLTTFRETCDFLGTEVGYGPNNDNAKWHSSPANFNPSNDANFNNVDGNHPGIHRNGTNGADPAWLALGNSQYNNHIQVIHSESMFDITFVAKITYSGANGGFRVGLFDQGNNRLFGNGYIFLSDPDEGADVKGTQRTAGSDTKTASIKTIAADTWYKFRMRRIDAAHIGFQVNDETEVVMVVTALNMPLVPTVQIWSNMGAYYYYSVDFADIIVTGLARY